MRTAAPIWLRHKRMLVCRGTRGLARLTDLRAAREREKLMPGPASDSYDPEFGTHAGLILDSIRKEIHQIDHLIGLRRHNIFDVLSGPSGATYQVELSEQSLRIIRFALDRSLDSI